MSKLDFFTPQQRDSSHDGETRSMWRLSSRDACYFVIGILIAYATLGW